MLPDDYDSVDFLSDEDEYTTSDTNNHAVVGDGSGINSSDEGSSMNPSLQSGGIGSILAGDEGSSDEDEDDPVM